jgi:hypothetical protein
MAQSKMTRLQLEEMKDRKRKNSGPPKREGNGPALEIQDKCCTAEHDIKCTNG